MKIKVMTQAELDEWDNIHFPQEVSGSLLNSSPTKHFASPSVETPNEIWDYLGLEEIK